MRKDWEIKSLDEIATVKGGKRVPKGYKFETTPTLHPYITVADFTEDGTVCTKNLKYISDEVYEQIKNYTISSQDIYISIAGTIGKTGSVPKSLDGANLTENACKLVLHKGIDQKFVYSFTKTDNFIQQTGINTRVAAQPKLALVRLKTITFPIPPLPEQKRIVAILDEAFEGIDRAIANTEKNLTNASELFESYLKTIFTQKGDGWKEKTLQEISIEFSRGKSKHRPRGDKKLYGGKYPLIQTGDISNSKHRITSYSQTYNELGLAQSKMWSKGTVCIAIVGANVAETAILDFDACFPDSVIGIIVNNEVADSDYVEYLLQSFKAELKEKGKGTARDNINIGTFANQKFLFPDVKTQKIIAGQLEELSFETQRLEAIYRRKIAALNELKQSILQKAFTGELTAETANQVRKTAKEEIAA
ncbi:restriction endonuclease subunit S [Chlorogloeopsis sp. ULAP01]|uniref:restriction endonuclease subunit S n=1 Tax=Chlorogloeopsis sp. ULAP01 TaxID=3056483 RepID=UPI0025AAF817|nr:restriction endonuclease subunit S [Chlorogloeopsis sp. ULAP01]MDM9383340.1 restriction endonuclease subunit S [Chlorogloeopsis sp. ULAP01]